MSKSDSRIFNNIYKEQERKALAQIRKIIDELGKDSHIAAAFDGCFAIAEDNIEKDRVYSMKQRAEAAEKKAADAFSTVSWMVPFPFSMIGAFMNSSVFAVSFSTASGITALTDVFFKVSPILVFVLLFLMLKDWKGRKTKFPIHSYGRRTPGFFSHLICLCGSLF